MTSSNKSDSMKTAVVGVTAGVVGAVVGATVAVMSDEKNRQKVKEFAQDAKETGGKILGTVQQNVDEAEQTVQDAKREMEKKGKKALDRTK